MHKLAAEIHALSHLGGTFTLRSGRQANTYFDKYRFETMPELLAEIAREMVPLIPEAFSDESTYLYSLEELLRYYGEAFVKNVYRSLLGRDPDPLGLSNNLRTLKAGAATREDIIRNILGSEEALRTSVRVIGINAHVPKGADPGDLIVE